MLHKVLLVPIPPIAFGYQWSAKSKNLVRFEETFFTTKSLNMCYNHKLDNQHLKDVEEFQAPLHKLASFLSLKYAPLHI